MKKIELKTKAWAKEYIANNFNGTATALKMASKNKLMNRRTAQAIASENLSKPIYQKEIIKELEEQGFNKKERARLLKRNAKQKRSYSASNQAIDIATKIEGDYAPQRRETLNINLTGKELDARIQEKLQELKQLQAQTG